MTPDNLGGCSYDKIEEGEGLNDKYVLGIVRVSGYNLRLLYLPTTRVTCDYMCRCGCGCAC